MPHLSRKNLHHLALALLPAAIFAWFFFHYLVTAVVNEPDEFWHLWSGRLIAETGKVTRSDPVCILTANYDWINLNWLAQLISYKAFLLAGLPGPATISSWLAVLIFLCHFQRLQRSAADCYLAVLSTALLFYALYYDYSSRPQIYSFALTGIVAMLLDRFSGNRRLPPAVAAAITLIMLVWNNLHGGAVYGYALLVCEAATGLIEGFRKTNPIFAFASPRVISILVIIVISLAGFSLHPHGFAALWHMLTYSSSMHPEFYQTITELMPVELASLQGCLFLLFLAVTAVGVMRTPGAARHRNFAAVILFAILTFKMRRLFAPLIIIGAPFIAGLPGAKIVREQGADDEFTKRLIDCASGLTVAMLLYWTLIIVPNRSPEREPGSSRSLLIDPQSFPVRVAELIRDRRLDGRIFNNYGSGGYLGWVLYPQKHRVMMDGRGDLHSQGDGYERYLSIRGTEGDVENKLSDLQIQLVIDSTDSPLVHALKGLPDWRVELEDRPWILLSRINGQVPAQ